MPFCSQCGTENPDVAKFCFACGTAIVSATAASPPAAAQEVRKVVSIVFSDLKGSTSMGEKLDSESLREVMTRYFESMSAELERHGGTVEKFIGDAIMAVFGLPTLNEDDALRAVRAAAGMQRALVPLNDELDRHWGVRLTVRTGVNTGVVVAGDPTAGQRLVTGDAVNVAARLEQAAGAQEILLGELTYRLVRDYVDVEEVEPLELKGKAERVPAYRLVGVKEGSERPRRLDSPMVGRERELELLRGQYAAAIETRGCRLATVVGEAGVGKSRLVDELVRSLPEEVAVLRGRCLPYGDGITFWPFAEAVREAAQISERDTTEAALEKVGTLAHDAEVTDRVGAAIGLVPTPYSFEELAWGARKLFETLGRDEPAVVLFEDVHWAEPAFLELVEQVVAQSTDTQLLLVCTSRRELLERLPEWSTDGDAARIELELLSADETKAVAEHLLGSTDLDEGVRTRIVDAAEGNPLFVEQLLSMMVDDGVIVFEDGAWRAASSIGEVAVPPTIHALLSARIDRLGPHDRAVLEPAAVIGQIFVRDAVRHLAAEGIRPELDTRLTSLADKQLVEADRSRIDEDAFRFHHILIRDTAYDGILKRARATYHEQFVEWADGVNREGATEYEEILGYHLEQAHRYLSELGPLDEHGWVLGADGSERLASAGRRAFARGDARAAASLLGRAAELLPESDPTRLAILGDEAEALLQAGRFEEAEARVTEAMERGDPVGAAQQVAKASLVRLLVRLRTSEEERWRDDAAVTIAEAMAVFEPAEDHAGLAMAWRLLAWTHGTACNFRNAAEASERALVEAELAEDVRQQTRAATAYAAAAIFGPTPVSEAIERCEGILERVSGDRHSEGVLNALLSSLLAMRGEFDRARELSRLGRAQLEELGLDMEVASVANEAWRVEMFAGNPMAAERELRTAYEILTNAGEKYFLSTVAGLLAQTLYVLERYDEMEPLGRLTRDLATEDDVSTQALWRCVQGKLLARDGAFEAAEALVLEALAILEPTDHVLLEFGTLLDLAEVRRLAGTDAGSALRDARVLAEAKGSPIMAAAASELLAAAAQPSATS